MNKKHFLTALKVALIVGTALNFINQFQAIIAFDIQTISFGKIILNYCVPFLVSVYSSFVAVKKNGEK